MSISTKLNAKDRIEEYIKNFDHPLKNIVISLRSIILNSDTEIGEQIKWNSLSFYYTGLMKDFDPKEYKRDIIVINLNKKEFVMLVFPTGSIINDNSGLLEGNFKDSRKLVKITSREDMDAKKSDLVKVIKIWLSKIEK